MIKDPKQQKSMGSDSNSIETRLTMLERELESLKSLYDQHFAGISKRPPLREHGQWKQEFNSIPVHEIRSTVIKFRHQSLKAKHIQLSNLWLKVLKEIEEGTYRRDLFILKAKEHSKPEPEKLPAKTPEPAKKMLAPGLDALFEKYSSLASAAGQSIPTKEKFLGAIQKQIDAQKSKNPAAKIELGLQKDSTGKIQVKLKLAKPLLPSCKE